MLSVDQVYMMGGISFVYVQSHAASPELHVEFKINMYLATKREVSNMRQ
jgi:hypothetical protein